MKDEVKEYLTYGLTKNQIKGALIIMVRALNVFFMLWALGWLSVTGFGSGFARAEDSSAKLAQVQQDLTDSRKEYLTDRLLALKIEQCERIKNGQSARSVTFQFNLTMENYHKAFDSYPTIPNCTEIL